MSDGNSGAQLLKILVRIVLFIVGLIPGLIRLIIRGVKSIIAMFQNNKSEPSVVEPEHLEQKTEEN
ncbi:MAG: hypothetical protein PF445_08560 [Melioribacteraceae bacterium]|jgi:hypothetical protein|nr:hypothetical protein [Melioribacteraceae bacterium]